MSLPVTSVVMSVFNAQAFLSEAIESILRQTFRDFESVIIDDGSSDRTAEILSAYAIRDARVRVSRHENMGRAESLNIGISLARGRYIARMDADDICTTKPTSRTGIVSK
jgi:glycosyltransferase involved in cell wall biosynthesis